MKEITYKINEIFYSLQGEGYHTGQAAIFIRLSGCNLKCPFCDTNFSSFKEMTIDEIMDAVNEAWQGYELPDLCVITGGEPSLQLEPELIVRLKNDGYMVCVETNGTGELPINVDFITISPKEPFVGGVSSKVILEQCEEIKVVMTSDITDEQVLAYEDIPAGYYFIQPCDTGFIKDNKKIMNRCVEFVKNHPNWRLSLQQQKILNVR